MSNWSNERDRPQARIIADSISPRGIRLTTMEVTFARFVLAEFNTHRVFSRNSESSRAVPTHKRIERARRPMVPEFTTEQRGMSGGKDGVTEAWTQQADILWVQAAADAARRAEQMSAHGVHKSVINRILEPFLFHTVVVTATEWAGFFTQRLHEAAQPEIRVAAEAMKVAMEHSVPTMVDYGRWHLPFIEVRDLIVTDSDDDADEIREMVGVFNRPLGSDLLCRISAARCARTSYLTHDGVRSRAADLTLWDRLVTREHGNVDPIHWSPLEHPATPSPEGSAQVGNLVGWTQLRHAHGDTSPYSRVSP